MNEHPFRDMALVEEWLRTASRNAVRRALRDPARFRASVLPRLRLRALPAGTPICPVVVWVQKEPFSIQFSL